jgi:hypothetical protein
MASTEQKRRSAERRARNREHGKRRTHPRVRARPIYAGRTYKVTRRCLERRMFFCPDAKAEQIENLIGYCLGHAANRYGIQVHACVFMSNHHHTDLSDPDGNLVAFKQLFHSMLARGINALRGRFEQVWSRDRPCDTRRVTDDETLADLVYTLTNPVEAGLVKWGHQWECFTTHGWRFGEVRRFKRPGWFFDAEGEMPEVVTLTLHRPPVFRELSDDALSDKLAVAVRKHERSVQAQLRAANRRFMGQEKVRLQHWNAVARSYEERFTQAPRVAASSVWLRLAALDRDREWERTYAAAREELLAGGDPVFPAGTYWLRRYAGVRVADRGPP